MIFCPPGSAKTTYASIVFPSHYLGSNPGARLLLTSYGDLPAKRMGRRTRSIMRQPLYKQLFKTELSQESSAAEQFSLTNGSEYLAASLRGAITSYRADGAIVDDPVRGRSDAESESEQATTREAFTDDVVTRLVPGGWLVMIMTRWHHEDLAGGILPEDWTGDSGVFMCRDGREWEVLCLQAKCESTTDPLGRKLGEYLWPQWFDQQHWIEHERDSRKWNSLYQQRPRPLEGAYFQQSDFLVVHPEDVEKPVDQRRLIPPEPHKRPQCVVAFIDTASKTGKEHDGIGVVYASYSPMHGTPLTILDWELTQIDAAFQTDWIPSVFQRCEELAREVEALMGSIGAFIEDKDAGMMLLQHAPGKGWPLHGIDSKLTALGKVGRALSVSGYIHGGKVKISRAAYEKRTLFKGAMRNHLLSQLLAFSPDVKDQGQDDLLDAATYSVAVCLGNNAGF